MESNKRHLRGTLQRCRSTRVATLINDPDRLGEMTGHTSVNYFWVAALSIRFTDGTGAKDHSEESSGILNGTPDI